MKTTFKTAAALLLTLCATSIHAQSDDFGMDFSLSAEKKLTPAIELSVEGNARTQDNTSKMDRWSIGTSISAKVYNSTTFNIKAFAGWEYLWMHKLREKKDKYDTYTNMTPDGEVTVTEYEGYNETLPYWRDRHRTSVGASASYKPNKRWSFQLKETVQYSHYAKATTEKHKYRFNDEGNLYQKSADEVTKSPKDRTILRSRLSAEYNIKHCPLNPYASAEYGCGLSYNTSKWKFTAGTDYKINKKNILTAFYRYQTENDDDDPNGHIIGIGYKIKL